MLTYCYIYPIELPARYSNQFACYDTVYILTNWELERPYLEQQKKLNPEGEFVFMPYGKPMNTERFNLYLKRYCNALGVQRYSSRLKNGFTFLE